MDTILVRGMYVCMDMQIVGLIDGWIGE
jgi:hypothetical protein